MIKRFYKATSGFFDLNPGKGDFQFEVKTTDDGRAISGPRGKFVPEFNEVQTEGDADLRREYLPTGVKPDSILFMDHPDYDALKLRLSAMATKNIPLEHDACFVARWMCLANLSQQDIEKGNVPPTGEYTTTKGNWGGLRALKMKKSMLKHIKQMDSVVRKQLGSSSTSAAFARNFVQWRETLDGRLIYQPVEDGE